MLFSTLFNIILHALFPISTTEMRVLSYSPSDAYRTLPRAPEVPLTDATAIFAYKNELVTQLIWSIKYKRSVCGLTIGAYALHERLKELRSIHTSIDSTIHPILIPIPSSTKRLKERGFNQCELLVHEIKKLDTENTFTVTTNVLIRSKHISRQTLKNRVERLESARNVFSINTHITEDMDKDTHVIIIDDVITTGSTMKTAIDAFKEAGFTNVRGLSLAH